MLLQRPPSAGCHRIIHRLAGKCLNYSGSLGRLSYLLQQKQQLLLKTAPFGIMVNRRKVHIFFHCKDGIMALRRLSSQIKAMPFLWN